MDSITGVEESELAGTPVNLSIPVPQVSITSPPGTDAAANIQAEALATAAGVTSEATPTATTVEALMRLNHAWQQSVETATLNQYHLRTALPMLEQARLDATELTEQLQVISDERDTLQAQLQESEALRRSLEVQAVAAAAPQPPPVIDTPAPPLPTPVAVNPAAGATINSPPPVAEPLPDPVPDLLVAISHTLGSATGPELRATPGLAVTQDQPNQLTLAGPYMNAVHSLDSYSSDVLTSTLSISTPQAVDTAPRVHEYLEAVMGPAADSTGSHTLFYGLGQDVELTVTDNSTLTIIVTHTGLGVGPIHVYDAPPKEEAELPPIVTRYD